MSLRSSAAGLVTHAMGFRPLVAAANRLTTSRLRVLAYHSISDGDAFAAQMALVSGSYAPVSEERVRSAVNGGPPLPDRALWVTFDDGDPSVVEVGLPILRAAGVPATLYVCPGLIESAQPPWWSIVSEAARQELGAEVAGSRLSGSALVTALKEVPDDERREIVARLLAQLGGAGTGSLPAALTVHQLGRWLASGYSVGNHTWDHPCLDRCAPDQQSEQIVRAHEWLVNHLGRDDISFAYPNGDRTEHAESVLRELGYSTALLFDHRLGRRNDPALRTSRLRLDADATLPRARAVLSGIHSATFAVIDRAPMHKSRGSLI